MKNISNDYFDVERYISLLFDEMKIRSNLVFDKYSGQLIGFTDVGDPTLNYADLEEEDTLASHILPFLLRGICTNLKFNMAYFATHNLSSTKMMSLFWEAVFILEKSCNLWLIAATADGASPNRCFFKLHQNMDGMSSSNVCYRTIDIWARHRFIWFISDPPHLIKTLRNCLHHSSFGKSSHLMWNNDQYMLWEQIGRVYHLDKQDELQ